MKKILSCILAVVMIASMSVTAFAAESATNTGGDTEIPVEGIYVPSGPVNDVISVCIEWEGLNFVYTEGKKGEWQPSLHEYAKDESGDYHPEDPGSITVKNHSNVSISASMTFEATVEGATPWFTDENKESYYVELKSAEGVAYESAPSSRASFFVHSWAYGSETDTVDIGTVTVKIAQIPHLVSTVEELQAAFARGGDVKLISSFNTNTETIYVDGVDVNLDLNGYTVYGNSNRETFWVKSGTLIIKDSTGNGGVAVGNAVSIERGTVVIRSGYFTTIPFQFMSSWSTVVIEGGTFGEDPTKYVDTESYDVTDNGDGTYTVTAKQA